MPNATDNPYVSASRPNSGAATPPEEGYFRVIRSTAVTIGKTNSPAPV